MTYSKSLYKDLVGNTILYIFIGGDWALFIRLIRNLTLANILVTGFSNPLDLLIFEYMRSFQRIKYIIPGPTCKYTALSFSHITFRLFLSIMLLNKLLLTPSQIILVVISIAIWSSFLLWTQRVPLLIVDQDPIKIRSQTSYNISIVLSRAAYFNQLKKLMSFLRLLLDIKSKLIKSFVVIFSGFIMLAKFIGVYKCWPVFIT